MPDLDLPADWRRMVVELLSRHVPGAEVWAYGSRVSGGSHAASDLDLVVRNPGNLDLPQPGVSRLREAFVESDVPIIVDVLDWARLPATFHREIERAYVVLPTAGEVAGVPLL